jgi:hypothetical protein
VFLELQAGTAEISIIAQPPPVAGRCPFTKPLAEKGAIQRVAGCSVFLYGFAKNALNNIEDDHLHDLRTLAAT